MNGWNLLQRCGATPSLTRCGEVRAYNSVDTGYEEGD